MNRIKQFKKDKRKAWIISLILIALAYVIVKAVFAGFISPVIGILLCFPLIIICIYLDEKLEKYCKTEFPIRIFNAVVTFIIVYIALFSSLSFKPEIMCAIGSLYLTAISFYEYKNYPKKMAGHESKATDH